MKTCTIELPLRTIHFKVFDRKQSSFEAAGVEAYKNLHQDIWAIKQQWLKCLDIVADTRKLKNDMQLAYDNMDLEVRKYGHIAGMPEEEDHLPRDENNKFSVIIGDLQKSIDAFSGLVDLYNEERFGADVIMSDGEEMNERLNESFTHFDRTYFSPMLHDYDNMQIDMASFDDDFQLLKTAYGEIDEMRDAYIDEWNELMEDFRNIDKKVKVLNKHIDCISVTLKTILPGSGPSELN